MANIVVIEDEEALAEIFHYAFGPSHDVKTFTAGRKALDHLLSSAPVDLIFCDLMMPDITGMDVFDHVSSVKPELVSKIVFMSGGAVTERAKSFLGSLPSERIIEKPFSLKDLRDALTRFLR